MSKAVPVTRDRFVTASANSSLVVSVGNVSVTPVVGRLRDETFEFDAVSKLFFVNGSHVSYLAIFIS